ncbi:MAG: ABC transporter ATP-binding protein [Alphaproteobacteria bacterium]
MRIGIEDLAVAYDARRVIDGLSVAIEPGSVFTLLGPSGCGKTTLLRAIAGFVPVAAGRILFGERDVARLRAHRRNIGMVFQASALFPDKTVFDNVAYGLRARNVAEAETRARVGEALERVGLGTLADRVPAALSGGQRQRVALVRALVIRPDVLLMDEPLSNLDTKLRHQVRETIGELQREAGITTLFVTHDQEEALAMSDRIAVMHAGRFEQVGTPAEIYRTPCSAYVADFIGAANIVDATIASACEAGGLAAAETRGGRVAARCPRALPVGAVRLVLRPEDISLAKAGDGDGLAGRIARRQYLGSRTNYVAELAGGLRLSVDRSGEGHDRFAIGDTVALLLDPARCLAIAP